VANVSSPFSAMHEKFAVFDDARVITGACNWTSTAFDYSNEDLLVIEDAALAARYTAAAGDILAKLRPRGLRPRPLRDRPARTSAPTSSSAAARRSPATPW
jgi:phosphatidylserine/phosphatidylglycerophosphate/cardiolipin synthase-like enzyme